MREKLEKRLKEIEAEFKNLQGEMQTAQKSLNDKQAVILRLDGEYAGLKKLLEGDKVTPIVPHDS